MNPSKVQARKMVLVSVFALALLSTYRDRKDASPQGSYRTMWGVAVVGMFLSLLADFAPQIAGPFAALVVLGSLTHGGEQALAKALGTIAPASGNPGGGTVGSNNPNTTTRPNSSGGTTTQTGP